MTELRIPPAAIRWTETFLEDRQAALAFDQQQEEMTPIETGIPQGSPASPVLFLLYLRPLFDTLQRNHPLNKCPSYIDDICLIFYLFIYLLLILHATSRLWQKGNPRSRNTNETQRKY